MTSATRRIQRHRQAKKILDELVTSATHVQIIHYSCESFYDRLDESSPRITSIAIRNLASGSTRSFSIHSEAEIAGLNGPDVDLEYDSLEKSMLDDYFEFVEHHLNDTWVHWNMRNNAYGFQAIEHRYRVLGGKPTTIPEANKADLASLLVDKYGSNYVDHPRLQNLVMLNDISDKDFLPGQDEANAFEEHDYYRMHLSTLRKTHVLSQITTMADEGLLKTNMLFRDVYGLNPEAIGELLKDHWLAIIVVYVLTFAGLIVSIIGLVISLNS